MAFFGMLFFIAWRLRLIGPIMAALLAATLAFVIGLSRLYLIEHYLTDVLNGWLVGSLWLLIGIALAEWWREARRAGTPATPPAMRTVATWLTIFLCAFAGWQVAAYDKARNVVLARPADEIVTDIAALFASGKAPNTTESIIGTPLEPVNLVILSRDTVALEAAMENAGWIPAEKLTLSTLARAGWALMSGLEDDTAPVTPYFWLGQPNDLAFQKPTADKTIRKRHHVRYWRSDFMTPQGLRLFVGAASFDDGLD